LFSSVVVVANHDNVQLRRRAQQQNQLPYELTEPCMALIQEIQGKGPDGNGVEGPGPSLACELPNGMIYSLPRQVASPAWIQEKVDQGELHRYVKQNFYRGSNVLIKLQSTFSHHRSSR